MSSTGTATGEARPAYLEYYERLLRLDRTGALALVREYLDGRGGDVEALYVDLLMPALIHTGQEWEKDRISVAHEHYISEVTRDLIHRYGPTLWSEAGGDAPIALACCAPGERHTLGLMMVCDVLRSMGLEVRTLGEGAPSEAIRDFAAESAADLLCLSVSLAIHLPDAARLIRQVRDARPGLRVLVGGPAFEGAADRALGIGADHFAVDARAVRALGADFLRLRETGP